VIARNDAFMSQGSGEGDAINAIIDFLVGMWFLFSEMASLLRRFSMSAGGDLGLHAALASNRLSLLAKNLEDGLSYLGADFLRILNFESLKKECGAYVAGIMEKLTEMLSAFSDRLKAPRAVDVRAELREFEDAISIAINAFSRMLEMVSEHREDERAKFLTILLSDLVSDLKIIGVRLQQAKSQLRLL